MQSHQAARTSRVNSHTGTLEVKEPANTVGQDCIGYACGLVFQSRFRIRVENSLVVVIESADEH